MYIDRFYIRCHFTSVTVIYNIILIFLILCCGQLALFYYFYKLFIMLFRAQNLKGWRSHMYNAGTLMCTGEIIRSVNPSAPPPKRAEGGWSVGIIIAKDVIPTNSLSVKTRAYFMKSNLTRFLLTHSVCVGVARILLRMGGTQILIQFSNSVKPLNRICLWQNF